MNIKQIDYSKHKDEYLKLNIEFLSWIADEMKSRYKFDLAKMEFKTAKEYVQNKYEELTKSFENKGIFYLIEIDGNVVGMGGLRKLTENVCEIKRMYIRPKYRGLGFGKKLTQMLIKSARKFGYSLIKLESSLFMETTHHIYRSYGFKDCVEYPGVETPDPLKAYSIYMEKEIS